jgi:hypothetical protein
MPPDSFRLPPPFSHLKNAIQVRFEVKSQEKIKKKTKKVEKSGEMWRIMLIFAIKFKNIRIHAIYRRLFSESRCERQSVSAGTVPESSRSRQRDTSRVADRPFPEVSCAVS